MATRVTKKEQAVELHDQGLSVEEIASRLKTSPTYVANTLIESGERRSILTSAHRTAEPACAPVMACFASAPRKAREHHAPDDLPRV